MNGGRLAQRWTTAALLLLLVMAASTNLSAADGPDRTADGIRRLQDSGVADDIVVGSSAGSGSGSSSATGTTTTASSGTSGGTTSETTSGTGTTGTTSGTGTTGTTGTTSGTGTTGTTSTGAPSSGGTTGTTPTSNTGSGLTSTASGSMSEGSDSNSGSSSTPWTSPPPTTTKPTTPSTPVTTAPSTTTTAPTTSTNDPSTPASATTTAAPATTDAPATSTPQATTGSSVVHYNSSTLPPSIDESDLNGAQLMWVEVTKTINPDGTTTYSYMVVTKVNGQIQTYNETSVVATNTISSLSSSSSGSASNQAEGAQASDGKSSSATSGLSSGALIAVVVGGLVFVALLIGFFVFRRRQILNDREEAEDNDDMIESPVQYDNANRPKGPSTWGVNYEEVTSKTATTQSSARSASQRTRRSGSEWEDPVIVAARVPFDRVKIGELLGKGAYGEVHRGEFRDQIVAIKKLLPDTRKNMKHITDFLSEIHLLATMEHPHIVQFVGVAWDALTDLMCLTEFMAGGDLRSLLINYHEARHPLGFDAQKVTIALHVAHGLTYLHSLNPIVLHRDLKSRNILLTKTLQAKLTDFGVSRERSDRTMTAGVGSCLWMAPEVMMGKRYDEKADVFSLGVVLSELDTHELPYSHAKDSQTGAPMMDMAVLQQVSAGRLRVQLSNRLLPSLRYLVTACVSLDPRQRPTAAQALYELQVISRSLQ